MCTNVQNYNVKSFTTQQMLFSLSVKWRGNFWQPSYMFITISSSNAINLLANDDTTYIGQTNLKFRYAKLLSELLPLIHIVARTSHISLHLCRTLKYYTSRLRSYILHQSETFNRLSDFIIEATTWQNQQNECAQRRLRSAWASAQPRLIRVFAERSVGS